MGCMRVCCAVKVDRGYQTIKPFPRVLLIKSACYVMLFINYMRDIGWYGKAVAESHQVKQRNAVSEVTIPAFVAEWHLCSWRFPI